MPRTDRFQKHKPEKKTVNPATDARSAALVALERLADERTTLDALLEEPSAAWSTLARRDRALFNQLVYGVLRWRMRLDAIIGTHSDRPVDRIAPTVLNILRLALFQMRFMDRIPPSAAVNTAVDLARRHKASRATGFINALLRGYLRDPDRFQLPDKDQTPVDHLAVGASLPHWLARRWIERMGLGEATALAEAVNRIPPITLRCNTLKNGIDDLEAALAGEAERIVPVEGVSDALHLTGLKGPVARMPAFAEGRFAVQDAAAQLVSLMLDPQPGESVLDACAGLGGKTGHLAALMQNRGSIVALDSVDAKLDRLAAEMQRLGATIVSPRRLDLNDPPATDALPRFDRILLDAPCSGLGVLRRNPDAKWSTGKRAVTRFADRQLRFLGHLAPVLKPGGVMVYAVCSMEPEENERVIERFLKNHPNFAISRIEAIEATCVHPYLNADGHFRTFPHRHAMDGFFAARLRRIR